MDKLHRSGTSDLPSSVQRPPQSEVLAALDRMRDSRVFTNSEKLFQFLEFVVLDALRGEGPGLKETSIGVGLYHRVPSYDPKRDSIVRTQATRLRDRLEEYYRDEGSQEALEIRLNRGSYVPIFLNREALPSIQVPLVDISPGDLSPVAGPSVDVHAPAPETAFLKRAKGLRRTIVSAALGLPWLIVIILWIQSPGPLKVANFVQLTHDGQPKWLVGTDGVRIYLGTGNYATPGLAQLSISGGDPVSIPLPPGGLLPLGLSGEGDRVLLSDYYPGNLWSLHLVNGAVQRLRESVGPEAAWSADSKSLAYAKDDSLWVSAADGTEPRKLLTIPSRRIYAVQWSPEGTRLRFTIWQKLQDVPSLWEVSANGTNLHALLPGWHQPSDEANGRWTADGRYYVFQSRGQIWALKDRPGLFQKANRPLQLTNSPLKLSSPLPGRDDKSIFAIGRTQRGVLVRYDAATRQPLPYLSGISAEFVDFSRDGQWIAYVTYPEGVLWRSRRDGSARLRLTYSPLYASMPRWSPDGKRIVFSAENRSGTYSVPFEGGEPELMFKDGPAGLGDVSWAPDGTRMALSRNSVDRHLEAWIADARTQRCAMIPGGKGYFGPRWSPDGRHIVAIRQNPIGLSLFSLQTGKWSDLARITGGFPNWSHDGKYVYYLRFPTDPAVVKINISNGNTEVVADMKDFRTTGAIGTWLGLAPDESPLLLRDAGTQDVFALELAP